MQDQSTVSQSADLSPGQNNLNAWNGTDVPAVSSPKAVSISSPPTKPATVRDEVFDESGMPSESITSRQGSASLSLAANDCSNTASSFAKEPNAANTIEAYSTITVTHPSTAPSNAPNPGSSHLPEASTSNSYSRIDNHEPLLSNKPMVVDNADCHDSQTSLLSESEKRLAPVWNLHHVKHFTDDYNGTKEDLSSMWESTCGADLQRPTPYEKDNIGSFQFLPITKSESYIDILRNPSALSTDKLYAITANTAQALKVWQDEYLAIEKLLSHATHQPRKSDPRRPSDPRVFEDKKEAMLYGYKHDAKETSIGIQDPFLQGGFKPNAAQTRKILAQTANPENPDGWIPTVIDGVEYIPGVRRSEEKSTARRRRAQSDIHASNADVPSQRTTRFNGVKHPTTKEVSVSVSPSHPPAIKPPGKRRGRPPAKEKAALLQQTVEEKPPVQKRPYRRRNQQSTVQSEAGPSPVVTPPPPPPAPPPPAASHPQQPQPVAGQQANEPYQENPSPKRQEKIRVSRNPKRTEAMIRHWAKFNSEGRTRNPKRTKAQIEAVKAAGNKQEGAGSKRKRSKSTKPPISSESAMPIESKSDHNSSAEVAVKPFARTTASGESEATVRGVPAPPQSSMPPSVLMQPPKKRRRRRNELTMSNPQDSHPPHGEPSNAPRQDRLRPSELRSSVSNPQNPSPPDVVQGLQPPFLSFKLPPADHSPQSQTSLPSQLMPLPSSHAHPHPHHHQPETHLHSHTHPHPSHRHFSFHPDPHSSVHSTLRPAHHQHPQLPTRNPTLLPPPEAEFINMMSQQR